MMNHWNEICQRVADLALPIFPHIRSKKVKSEIISHLFESQAAAYFTSIGVPVKACDSDREPDLIFLKDEKPLEIKVTGIDLPYFTSAKWMGGKYSKRSSDYVFVAWNYQEPMNTLYGPIDEKINYFIAKTHVKKNDWDIIDGGKNNYYATVFRSEKLLLRPHEILMGEYDKNRGFVMV